MKFNSKVLEEFGFKAAQKGFFTEWRSLVSFLSKNKSIALCEAAEDAFKTLSQEKKC